MLFYNIVFLITQNFLQCQDELIKALKKHEDRYNNTAKTCLNFKSPYEIVIENKLLLDLY